MSGSDNYEVTLQITVGGDDPADAARRFLLVLDEVDSLVFDVENLEEWSADRYWRVEGFRDGSSTTEARTRHG